MQGAASSPRGICRGVVEVSLVLGALGEGGTEGKRRRGKGWARSADGSAGLAAAVQQGNVFPGLMILLSSSLCARVNISIPYRPHMRFLSPDGRQPNLHVQSISSSAPPQQHARNVGGEGRSPETTRRTPSRQEIQRHHPLALSLLLFSSSSKGPPRMQEGNPVQMRSRLIFTHPCLGTRHLRLSPLGVDRSLNLVTSGDANPSSSQILLGCCRGIGR